VSIASKTGYLVKIAILATRSRKTIGLLAHEGGEFLRHQWVLFLEKSQKNTTLRNAKAHQWAKNSRKVQPIQGFKEIRDR
jgi:hypothetical protein